MIHHLKSWPEFFAPVFAGEKRFELRRNDRNFQRGDTLILREWEPNTDTYTGRECTKRVGYVLYAAGHVGAAAPFKGLNLGYCIMSLE